MKYVKKSYIRKVRRRKYNVKIILNAGNIIYTVCYLLTWKYVFLRFYYNIYYIILIIKIFIMFTGQY